VVAGLLDDDNGVPVEEEFEEVPVEDGSEGVLVRVTL
jgi:hypothetical protein